MVVSLATYIIVFLITHVTCGLGYRAHPRVRLKNSGLL